MEHLGSKLGYDTAISQLKSPGRTEGKTWLYIRGKIRNLTPVRTRFLKPERSMAICSLRLML